MNIGRAGIELFFTEVAEEWGATRVRNEPHQGHIAVRHGEDQM
jgi:hypothetical protein